MRSPKPRKFTQAQEAAMEESERLFARAQIYRAGVKDALSLDYPGPFDLEVSIHVLQDARLLEEQARGKRRFMDIGNPGTAKRANPRRPRSGGTK